MKKNIFHFFRNQFSSLQPDEKESIHRSLKKGQDFIIFGSHYLGTSRHVVGCVLFADDEEGIFVNWIAVSGEKMDAKNFGTTSNNQCFWLSCLGMFLMLLVQIRSALLGWSTTIYLQA